MTTITIVHVYISTYDQWLCNYVTYPILFVQIINIKVLIGESGYTLSALPRGHRVLFATNESYQVGDHDFTKINMIPTVILLNNIPEKVEDSLFRDKPYISSLKLLQYCPLLPYEMHKK